MTEEEILTCDKSDWYTKNKDGSRVWNAIAVHNFWQILKSLRIDKNEYCFENISFPSCSMGEIEYMDPATNYFVEIFNNGSNTVNKLVVFKNCRFQANCFFLGHLPGIVNCLKADIILLKGLHFENCYFERDFKIQGQKIIASLIISNCQFLGEGDVSQSIITGSTRINESVFKGGFTLYRNKFISNFHVLSSNLEGDYVQSSNMFQAHFSISAVKFHGEVTFFSNTYSTYGTIGSVKFNQQSTFRNEVYNHFQFSNVDFSSNNHLFESNVFIDKSELNYRNIVFSKHTNMRNCNFTRVRFLQSEISEIKFSASYWGATNRIVLLNENNPNIGDNNGIEHLENLYRELKRNFENQKDWELAGRSYVSELKFRQQRLLTEKKYFSWLIYWFYDFFGGYTESYVRPTFWFISFTFLIFPQYYRVFENNSSSYSEFFIKSIAASAPWLHTDLEYQNWGILALQKTFSAILITFIILALRKRFR